MAKRPAPLAAVGLLAFAAGLVSLLGAWHVSLWKDETDSVSASDRSVSGIWRLTHHIDAVHGAYYLTLHGWIDVFGRSPAALRSLSALAVAVAAAGVYLLARELSTTRDAVVATVVFAVLPRVTWMGIEARSFAWTAALAVWAVYAFVRAVRTNTPRWWIAYAVLAGAGAIVNVYVGLLVVANGITLVVARGERTRLRPWALAAVGAGILAAPVALESLGQRGQLGDTAIGTGTLLRSVVINQWFLGNTPTPNGQATGSIVPHHFSDLWRPTSILLALLGWVLIVIALVARRRTAEELSTLSPTTLLVPWVVVPTVVVVGYSLVGSPMYSARYFSFCTPALALLLALGLASLGRRWVQVLAAVLGVALIVPIYVSQRRVDGKGSDWSRVAAYVQAHKQPGQAVYFAPRYPPRGTSVSTTLRYVEEAYPKAFTGLRDLTLVTTGVQDDSLTGRSRLLSASLNELGTVSAVWVIRRRDYPAGLRTQDDADLARAGFRPARSWRGPVDVVVEFVRG